MTVTNGPEVEHAKTWVDFLLALGSIVTALVGAARLMGPRVSATWDRIFPLGMILERLDELASKLDRVEAETQYNGGGTTKAMVRKTLEQLTAHEFRLRSIMSVAPTPLYECNASGDCTWVNDQLCELFGMEHSDMLGRGWLRAITQDSRAEEAESWFASVRDDIPYSRSYVIENQRTGELNLCRTTAEALRHSDGKVLMYQGAVDRVRPITKQEFEQWKKNRRTEP